MTSNPESAAAPLHGQPSHKLDRTDAIAALEGCRDAKAYIAGLRELSVEDIRDLWSAEFKRPAPLLSKNLCSLSLAYRFQERRSGKTLGILLSHSQKQNQAVRRRRFVAGTRFLREWEGKTHHIEVSDHGFEHEGSRYTSLSAVAKAITGAHWSGPRFFGLEAAQ